MTTSDCLALEGEGASREEGRALMERGVDALKAERLEEAQQLFEQSLHVYPSFDVAGNLGLVEVKLGLWGEAAMHLEYCLRNFPSGESERLRKAILQAFEEARKNVGKVEIVVDVDGAEVFVGKRSVGMSPLAAGVYVEPGSHGVRARKGVRSAETTFSVDVAKVTQVQLTLTPEAERDEPPKVSPGLERLTPQESPKRVFWGPAIALGSATVVTLGASFVLRGLAKKQSNQAQNLLDHLPGPQCAGSRPPDQCTKISDHRKRYNSLAKASHGTFIAAGALGAATLGYVIYAIVRTPKRTQPAVSLSPLRGGGHLAIHGAF